ncbi:pancreatic triacylglycerol lipase-like [Daktulosphaira vitifoliae]|uniref:pancreatic triacylglycerol lipase-like n=1 Tax=Daktulosphaira vitifoliae TaxID=58002 RepID=UPI0021A9836A|nr:pancreatic triacylglycerol lipase-like [Daktulosphaira vitifoliae]XP_050533072.1 pancreatic triacylglycerol lipase-like [Daktulosphaira vitifoliae]
MDINVLKKLTRSGFILLHVSILLIVSGETRLSGTKWASAELEAADEMMDLQIYKSVVQSMEEWRQRNSESKRHKRAEAKVCYPEVGCFDESGPYGYIGTVPNPPNEVNTRFLLYNSRRSRRDTPLLDVSFTNMTSIWHWAGKAFNVSAPTKVIVHGFGSSCSNVWVYEMRSALMDAEDCNIICVDWEAGAIIPNYVRAAANTRLVGKQVAMLISGLALKANLPIENVHLIGFSLGAHAAGYAGAELQNLSRITGLDPAGPLFENQDPKTRLDSTDAKFVDVIHSNGENLILGGLGAWQPMGHVDYYPNGGRMQKGCSNLFVGAVTDIIWSAPEVYGRSLCNHRRAYKFFTDSVTPGCAFPAVPCESYEKFLDGECFPCKDKTKCGTMGYYADKSPGRGKLYLLTRDEEPFCAHQYIAKVYNSPSALPVVSYGRIQIVLFGQLDINETFTITHKDDAKMTLGETLKRIIVPHPALQDFDRVQITYTAYKGWLSNGLEKWSIDKFILTDSYGISQSICKRDLVLQSDEPVVLPLYPGDCNLPELSLQYTEGVKDKTDYGNGQPEFGQQHINDSTMMNDDGSSMATSSSDTTAQQLSATLGVGIKEYMNVPWMPVLDIEPTGNSLDPSAPADRREHSGRGFIGGSRPSSTIKNHSAADATTEDEFPYDQLTIKSNGTTSDDINEPVLRPKSRFRMYRMPDGSNMTATGHGSNSSASGERSFIVHLLPQRLMNMIEHAERYARMAFSPFMWPSKERTQRALKYFPRFLFNENKTTEQVINFQQDDKPKNYIPLVFDQQQQRQSHPAKAEYKIIPAMTDDRPSMEENLNTKDEEEEHINIR